VRVGALAAVLVALPRALALVWVATGGGKGQSQRPRECVSCNGPLPRTHKRDGLVALAAAAATGAWQGMGGTVTGARGSGREGRGRAELPKKERVGSRRRSPASTGESYNDRCRGDGGQSDVCWAAPPCTHKRGGLTTIAAVAAPGGCFGGRDGRSGCRHGGLAVRTSPHSLSWHLILP
jgi:hypothetical protein